MTTDPPLADAPLGHSVAYPKAYDPGLLFPIQREENRSTLASRAPFFGADLWTAYELSWLNPKGKPQVAIAHFTIPCESQCLVESKSFKLYLNGFNRERFRGVEEVRARLQQDVAQAISTGSERRWTPGVRLVTAAEFGSEQIIQLHGVDLDRLDVECEMYEPSPELLQARCEETPISEVLHSSLLKTNCPVTGQPDWGSVEIAYTGAPIDQAGLLAYIVSFREHADFHEHCVERMFTDIWSRCRPSRLSVFARYTRRGGLDINPFRTSAPQAPPMAGRTARQ